MTEEASIQIQLEGLRRDQNELHQLILLIREEQIQNGKKQEWTDKLMAKESWLDQWLSALELKHKKWAEKQKVICLNKEYLSKGQSLVWKRKK